MNCVFCMGGWWNNPLSRIRLWRKLNEIYLIQEGAACDVYNNNSSYRRKSRENTIRYVCTYIQLSIICLEGVIIIIYITVGVTIDDVFAIESGMICITHWLTLFCKSCHYLQTECKTLKYSRTHWDKLKIFFFFCFDNPHPCKTFASHSHHKTTTMK